MKNYIEKLSYKAKTLIKLGAVLGTIVGTLFVANAQIITYQPGSVQVATIGPLLANAASNIITGAGRLLQLAISTTNLSSSVLYVYDSPNTNGTYSYGAYTQLVITVGSITNISTNTTLDSSTVNNSSTNRITTNVYTGLITTTNSIAANTNGYALLAIYNIPASNTVGPLVLNLSGQRFVNGIMVSNTGPLQSIVAQYATPGN